MAFLEPCLIISAKSLETVSQVCNEYSLPGLLAMTMSGQSVKKAGTLQQRGQEFLSDQVSNHPTVDVGEPKITARITVGKPLMVKAHEM